MHMPRLDSHRWRGALFLAVALTILALAAACGGDSEPEPAPTATQPPPTATPSPTPEPTPTATPSPTPEPTPAPATPTPTPDAAQPAGSMRDLVIDESSTIKDVMDRLSTEETDCVRAAFGEAVYQLLLTAPILQGGSPEATATLFGCLEPENVVLSVVAIEDALAGGRSEDTRRCLADLSLEHPELAYIQLGLEWTGADATHASEMHASILAYWDCLTDAESVRLGLRVFAALDSTSSLTGADLVTLLPESEAACMREILTDQQINTLLTAKPLDGVRAAAPAGACLSPATIAALYVAALEGLLGEITAESATCIADYAVEHPDFLPLLSSDPTAMAALSPAELGTIADGTKAVLSCYTEDELVRAQDLILAAMRQ